MKSIFGLSSTKDEPYLTQVFSYLLESDRQFCNFLINDIFDLRLDTRVKEIVPEASADNGRPDIVLVCENSIRIAIENKIDASFTTNQLKRYKIEFEYVILIYKFLSEPEQVDFATKSISWYSICSKIREYVHDLNDKYDLINKYLLTQFVGYLEETNMAIEKVSWEIQNGTKSLLNLFSQIMEAFERLKGNKQIMKYKSAGSSSIYTGWEVTLDKEDSFSVYVFYDPLLVISSFYDVEDNSSKFKRLGELYPSINWASYWHMETFDIGKNHFLCLSVDEQIGTIVEFLELSKQKYFQ